VSEAPDDVIARVVRATMTEGRRTRGQVLHFLREHAGTTFCLECLANALALSPDEVCAHVTEGVQGASIEAYRGRCSVCRSEKLVAGHRRRA
jgi:hypothetical protein